MGVVCESQVNRRLRAINAEIITTSALDNVEPYHVPNINLALGGTFQDQMYCI